MSSELKKADSLRQKIWNIVTNMDIPKFIKIEIRGVLNVLNKFKLENLYSNINILQDYLRELVYNYEYAVLKAIDEN